jgi:hypothetical protein
MSNGKHVIITLSILIMVLFIGIPILVLILVTDSNTISNKKEFIQPFKNKKKLAFAKRKKSFRILKDAEDFDNPQFFTNPTSLSEFGEFVFVHESGVIGATAHTINEPTQLVLYNITPTNSGTESIITKLSYTLEICDSNEVVVFGQFAPLLNVVGEVYLLLIATGTVDESSWPGYKFANKISLYTFDTNDLSAKWTKSSEEITHPYYTRPTIFVEHPIYKGTFGDNFQIVADDNSSQSTKHSLYVFGSQYTPSEPGGCLFWYIFDTNSTTPSIRLNYMIKDAKLSSNLNNSQNGTIVGQSQVSGAQKYMNSFGSRFFVQTGKGTSNRLAIANITDEDNIKLSTANLNAPFGYVQVFVQTNGKGWEQTTLPTNGKIGYFRRFYPAPDTSYGTVLPLGFGMQVMITDNYLLVNTSGVSLVGNTGSSFLYTYNLNIGSSFGSAILPPPLSILNYNNIGSLQNMPTYPGIGQHINKPILIIESNLLVESVSSDAKVNTIGIYNPSITVPIVDSSGKPSTETVPYKNWKPKSVIQTIGKHINHGSDFSKQRFGFGQWTHSIVLNQQYNVWLIINDPIENQFIILEKSFN